MVDHSPVLPAPVFELPPSTQLPSEHKGWWGTNKLSQHAAMWQQQAKCGAEPAEEVPYHCNLGGWDAVARLQMDGGGTEKLSREEGLQDNETIDSLSEAV